MISLIDKINENMDTYEDLKIDSEISNFYSEGEANLYKKFNREWEEYQDLSFRFFSLSRERKTRAAVNLLNGEAKNVFTKFSILLTQLVGINKKDAQDAAQRAELTFQYTRNITIILLIITLVFSIIFATILIRLITIPLHHLVKAVRNVSEGELDVQLNIVSKDEIGNLTNSFNLMTIALRQAKEKSDQEAKLRVEAADLKIKAAEAEARALKAENERKTAELEQARKLQLSMLPETVPTIPDLDISVYMKPATEVGGDYYDFKIDNDGTLTVALGDATGHGLNAGTMVAATKSLFNALVSQNEPVKFFKKVSHALYDMGFHGIYMAMIIAKFKQRKLTLSAAGMPFALIYRSISGTMEEVILKGVPLGSFPDFKYNYKELSLNKGDTVLFMSDGLPETFNDKDEMLGYETMNKLFHEVANESPESIIKHLVNAGEKWAHGRAQDDDITFVVLKAK
jgi:serine phosphatase RsbU (regulator of sigma subunit)